jgi:glucosylglycerol 3-phosphatase
MSYSHLNQLSLSLDHNLFSTKLINTSNLLIIQDLDGVCMQLVKNPLDRVIEYSYVKAIEMLAGNFFVLTNGEHIGKFGVNSIIDKAASLADVSETAYLAGLGAGGVQWQDIRGNIAYPGVTEAELNFLSKIPDFLRNKLYDFCQLHAPFLSAKTIERALDAVVLDNLVSPTVNLNTFFSLLQSQPEIYIKLQETVKGLMDELLAEAKAQNLGDSFFVHYAPNLGRNDQGIEIMRPATLTDSGTTDFQFMLRGALKEAGVLYLLNYYYFLRTGKHPLGKEFSPREVSFEHNDLLNLISANFTSEDMPMIMGVGDTVNSQVAIEDGEKVVRRGGSDRNFLQLIQDIGKRYKTDNIITYVDSSQGEVKNRKPIKVSYVNDTPEVIEGPGHPEDIYDPLKINLVFPEGHQQYCQFLINIAQKRINN